MDVQASLRAPRLIPQGLEGTQIGDHWGANPRPDHLSYPSGLTLIPIVMQKQVNKNIKE